MTRSRLSRSLLAMLGALALFATACGGSGADVATNTSSDSGSADNSSADSASSDSAAPAAEAETAEDEPAISLVASTIDGGQIDFGALEGQDVVLWFWAPW